jgi:choline transporter-like protein 2/4/5
MLSKAGAWGAAIAAELPAVEDPTGTSREYWAYIAYAMTAVTVLVFIFTLLMIRRVAVAVACIKVGGGRVFHRRPSILCSSWL